MISLSGDTPAHEYACSRARCDDAALWAIHWRNPKIHAEDRVKIWLACEEHSEYLRDFLEARSFPVSLVPIAELGHVE